MRLPTPTIAAALTLAASTAAHAAEKDDKDGARALETRPGALGLVASAAIGDGLRFNDPYRLATILGSDAQSVSRSATYVDAGLTMLLGAPYALRPGITLRWSIAVEGVAQSAMAPTFVLWKRWHGLAAFGRVGPSLVVSPQTTWGMEASGGGAWYLRGGIAVTAEIVGDLFYGAGTREVATPAYPMLSGELGIAIDWEVLP